AAHGDLPGTARAGKGPDKYFSLVRFPNDIRHPAAVRREHGASFVHRRSEKRLGLARPGMIGVRDVDGQGVDISAGFGADLRKRKAAAVRRKGPWNEKSRALQQRLRFAAAIGTGPPD